MELQPIRDRLGCFLCHRISRYCFAVIRSVFQGSGIVVVHPIPVPVIVFRIFFFLFPFRGLAL